jgi:hypothetical protein
LVGQQVWVKSLTTTVVPKGDEYMKFRIHKTKAFHHTFYEYQSNFYKLKLTLRASAVQSDTDHPLSAVERVHEPFDL